jgi:hypothetical protein
MKQHTVNTYSFDELSEEAKKHAIEKLCDINTDYEWYDCTIDDFKDRAREKGFDVDKTYFSGFWSQGDGAMFEGSVDFHVWKPTNIHPLVIKCIDNGLISLSWSVKHRGHYYHSKCRYIDFDYGNVPYTWKSNYGATGRIIDEMTKIEAQLEEDFTELCADLYRSLEEEYEYQTSEEAIIETIEANEYEFTEDGDLF